MLTMMGREVLGIRAGWLVPIELALGKLRQGDPLSFGV